MYIRRTTKSVRGRAYHTSLLVESVQTERGPRQRTICSLGSVPPAPPEHWPSLVREIEAAQSGQFPLTDPPPHSGACSVAVRRLGRRRFCVKVSFHLRPTMSR